MAGGVKWVGGEVVRGVVKARPGREGRIRAPRTQHIEGKFSMGKEAVPKVIREVGVGGGEGSYERKYSLHSNEVSLSQMRLGRGREWAVKKARMEVKNRT